MLEYEDDETEDGLIDYPMDGGDDGDDDDGDSSRDDVDDKDEDEEEEEHLASADSVIVIPTDELVSLPEGTEPGITWLGARPQLHYHHHHFHHLYTCHHLLTVRMIFPRPRCHLVREDRIAHQETIQILKEEAYTAQEAWAHSIGLSHVVHSELQTHQEQVYAHKFQLQAHQT
nr:hypothetical protein [Tanacetum cinerariifolium]